MSALKTGRATQSKIITSTESPQQAIANAEDEAFLLAGCTEINSHPRERQYDDERVTHNPEPRGLEGKTRPYSRNAHT